MRIPDVADWAQFDRLSFEAEAVGFHLTAHPLDAYRQVLSRLGVVCSTQLLARAEAGVSRAVKLAGTVIASKERMTRTGSRMAWVQVSDAAGSCEVTVFSEILGSARELLQTGSNLLITADLQLQGDVSALPLRNCCRSIRPLPELARLSGSGYRKRPLCRISGVAGP